MDSLVANYASSDEEQEQENQQNQEPEQPEKCVNPRKLKVDDEGVENFLPKPSRKIFDSLPPPKSSPFNSLPPPKSQLKQTPVNFKEPSVPKPPPELQQREELEEIPEVRNPKTSSSLFSLLPQPKSSSALVSTSLFASLPPPKPDISETAQIVPNSTASKKVVQFRPPAIVNPVVSNSKDSDEDEKEKQRKKLKDSVSTSSVKSFLSSIPAPKNSTTLGALPSAAGTGRRSILETDGFASNLNSDSGMGSDADAIHSKGYSGDQVVDEAPLNNDYPNWSSGNENYANYDSYGAGYGDNDGAGEDGAYSNWDGQSGDYANYGSNGDYANYSSSYADYGQCESNWTDGSSATAVAQSGLQLPGKRGRNGAPEQIVEVKQDELLKNRPREDQVKSTGIAFGPAYKPASSAGKPSKLHKRKHQIGSLLFDLRQKEMELAERRSKGFLTKAQTQAKYGW